MVRFEFSWERKTHGLPPTEVVRVVVTQHPWLLLLTPTTTLAQEVSHHYADNNGVKIHYVKAGSGPLVVMIHGFPDYWYSWRHQMNGLKKDFTVVAMDQRGYSHGDQPEGVDAYAMQNLVSDVVAVIRDTGAQRATVVGHDWGRCGGLAGCLQRTRGGEKPGDS